MYSKVPQSWRDDFCRTHCRGRQWAGKNAFHVRCVWKRPRADQTLEIVLWRVLLNYADSVWIVDEAHSHQAVEMFHSKGIKACGAMCPAIVRAVVRETRFVSMWDLCSDWSAIWSTFSCERNCRHRERTFSNVKYIASLRSTLHTGKRQGKRRHRRAKIEIFRLRETVEWRHSKRNTPQSDRPLAEKKNTLWTN